MARKKSTYFVVGTFVTLGTIAAVSLVLWLGASKYFRPGVRYATYFDESVQGLQVDSPVKYRGVEVGNVERIQVAPDNRLIEVVMKVNLRKGQEDQLISQLKAAGITGIMFVELDKRSPGKPDCCPPITFKSPYPVIPSQPSEIRQIFSEIEDIYRRIAKIDFEGISDRVKGTLRAVETTMDNPKIASILARTDSVTAGLDKTVQLTNRRLDDRRVDEILAETKSSVTDARNFFKNMTDELHAMRLAETAGKANRVIDALERRSRAVSLELEATSENLRQATDSFEQFVDRVNANPSDLLFSKPAEPRRKE